MDNVPDFRPVYGRGTCPPPYTGPWDRTASPRKCPLPGFEPNENTTASRKHTMHTTAAAAITATSILEQFCVYRHLMVHDCFSCIDVAGVAAASGTGSVLSYLVATLAVTGEQTDRFVEVLAARRRVQARAAAQRQVAHLGRPEVTLLRTGSRSAAHPGACPPAQRVCTGGV